MPFGKQSGEGAALPVAPAETVTGSGRRGGAARSPERARTRPAWTTTPKGRRLPLDRLGRGCVADRKTKRLRTGVSGRQPVDPPERHMDHPGPRLARASPVSSSCRSSQTGRQLSPGFTASLQLPARLTTGPCSIPGVSLTACCGLAPPLPRSFQHKAGQPGSRPASAVPPEGTRWAGQGDQDRRARDWLGTRQASARERPGASP